MSSSKTSRRTFHSNELHSAFEQVKEDITAFKTRLNQVSEDILSLEEQLTKADINIPFCFDLNEEIVRRTDQGVELNLGPGVLSLEVDGMPIEIAREQLRWGKDSNGKFRLLYQWSLHSGNFDFDGGGDKPYTISVNPTECDVRPLIETKMEVRMSVFPRLPEFVAALGKRLALPAQAELEFDIPDFIVNGTQPNETEQ